MKISQKQVQSQQQQQRMTASQRQTMVARILGSDMDLREIVSRETEENPALELEENDPTEVQNNISLDDLRPKEDNELLANTLEENDNWEPRRYDERTSPAENTSYERKSTSSHSFYSDLLRQLDEMSLSEKDKKIAIYIIGNLETTGYLQRSLRDLADDLLITYGERVSKEEMERVLLTVVQQLEPAGVGARNLAECLAIQLKLQLSQDNNTLISKALHIIENNFEDFSKKQFDQLMRKEGLTKSEFTEVLEIIRRLTPHPGPGEGTQYINPDFLVEIEDGKLKLSLVNEYRPKLRVSKEYNDLYNHYKNAKQTAAANQYKELIDKANNFIEILPEIHQTLYNVMAVILVIQEKFFMTGDSKLLQPMILKDIADRLNLDESTVSRCTSHRYVQTPYGIFLLKDLFSEATNKEDGVAATALREHIREIIDREDKRHPLTDEKIVEMLTNQGFHISRRTVAKYRDQLGISATSVRKVKN